MTKLSVSQTLNQDLKKLALEIRESLPSLDEINIFGLVAHVDAYEGSIKNVKPRVNLNNDTGITLNPPTEIPAYELYFGLGVGKVDLFRTPARAIHGSIKTLPTRKGLDDGPNEKYSEVQFELAKMSLDNLLNDVL